MSEKPNENSKPDVHIRWMIGRRDLPAVVDIENKSFEFPWAENDFVQSLKGKGVGMVAVIDDKVAGYMVYELKKQRLHLIRIAVDPALRRLGIGTQMMTELAGKLTQDHRSQVCLEVPESNLPAQLFFRDCGFKAVNTLKGQKENTPEDAYDMRLKKLPVGQKIIRAIEQMEKLTGLQWEVVCKNDHGGFSRCDVGESVAGRDLLCFRPRATLKDAHHACVALREAGFLDASLGINHERPEEVMVPVGSLTDMQVLRPAKELKLSDAFEPAERQRGFGSRIAQKRRASGDKSERTP